MALSKARTFCLLLGAIFVAPLSSHRVYAAQNAVHVQIQEKLLKDVSDRKKIVSYQIRLLSSEDLSEFHKEQNKNIRGQSTLLSAALVGLSLNFIAAGFRYGWTAFSSRGGLTTFQKFERGIEAGFLFLSSGATSMALKRVWEDRDTDFGQQSDQWRATLQTKLEERLKSLSDLERTIQRQPEYASIFLRAFILEKKGTLRIVREDIVKAEKSLNEAELAFVRGDMQLNAYSKIYVPHSVLVAVAAFRAHQWTGGWVGGSRITMAQGLVGGWRAFAGALFILSPYVVEQLMQTSIGYSSQDVEELKAVIQKMRLQLAEAESEIKGLEELLKKAS